MYRKTNTMKAFFIFLTGVVILCGIYITPARSTPRTPPDVVAADTLRIAVADSRLIVENLPYDTLIEIYSIVGTKAATIKAKAGSGEYLLNLPKGYYIVKVGRVVRKIAVK